jgi:hypothetical protein
MGNDMEIFRNKTRQSVLVLITSSFGFEIFEEKIFLSLLFNFLRHISQGLAEISS